MNLRQSILFTNSTLFLCLIFCLSIFGTSCKKDIVSGIPDLDITPFILQLNKTKAAAGDTVEIKGANFSAHLPHLQVMVDSTPAKVVQATDTKITMVVPNIEVGTKQIKVKVKTQTSNPVPFTVEAPAQDNNTGYFLSKPNVELWYHSETVGDGATDYHTYITGISDSVGSKLFRYRTIIPEVAPVESAAMVNSDNVKLITYKDGALQAMEDIIKQDPHLVAFSFTGLPFTTTFPAKPVLHDAINFSDPIRIQMTTKFDEMPPVIGNITITYSGGKVLGFEDVQVPGGAFSNCLKWTYRIRTQDAGDTGFTSDDETTLWFAKGIGMVKSVTTGSRGVTTCVLTDITNRQQGG